MVKFDLVLCMATGIYFNGVWPRSEAGCFGDFFFEIDYVSVMLGLLRFVGG